MRGRAAFWAGCAVTAAAGVAMGVYFADVGLGKATAVAGVIGAFVALAGLAVAVYGVATAGGPRPKPPPGGERTAPGSVTNIINGSTVNGTVIQEGRLGPDDRQAER